MVAKYNTRTSLLVSAVYAILSPGVLVGVCEGAGRRWSGGRCVAGCAVRCSLLLLAYHLLCVSVGTLLAPLYVLLLCVQCVTSATRQRQHVCSPSCTINIIYRHVSYVMHLVYMCHDQQYHTYAREENKYINRR